VIFIGKKFELFFYFFRIFLNIFEFQRFWDGSDGFDSRVSRVGHELGRVGWVGSGRDGSSTGFFQKNLLAPVLDPSVLTSNGSGGFEHELGQGGSRPWVRRVFLKHYVRTIKNVFSNEGCFDEMMKTY
jgi:hypothetical protein